MKNKTLIIVAAVIIILAVWIVAKDHKNTSPASTASSTTQVVKDATPASDEALYSDPGGRFTFTYPKVFTVTGPKTALTTGWRSNATTTGYLLATMNIPKSYLPNTNFSDAKLTVGESNNATEIGASGCPAGLDYDPGTATAVTINGQAYTKITVSDAAAGNRYDTTGYYTIRDGDCYVIEYTIHYGNIQNYDPSTGVKEFDEASLANVLDKVVKSLVFHVKSD